VSLLASGILALALRHQIATRPLLLSLFLTCISALITFSALPYQSHFNASDRVPERNIILGCGFALKVGLGIALAKMLHSFVGLPLGTVLIGVCEYLVQQHLVMKHLGTPVVNPGLLAEARQAIRARAKFVLAHRIGYLLIYQSDYLILLISSSLALLGYYAQYQYIYAGLLSFSIAIGGTLAARLAKRQIDLGREQFADFYRKTALLIAAGGAICGSGFFLFVDPAIHLLYRSTSYDHKAVLLFAVLLMLNIYKMNDDLWIDTTGVYEKGYYLPILEAFTYITLGLFLVRHFQMVGVLYAGILGNLLYSVFLKSFVIGRGMMQRELISTLAIKCLSLTGMVLVLYLAVLASRATPFLRMLH
jgi:O-antigen/teichoic acid export membrane protein